MSTTIWGWVLPPLDKHFNMVIYIALNRTPNIDCYWVGAVPKFGVRSGEVVIDCNCSAVSSLKD